MKKAKTRKKATEETAKALVDALDHIREERDAGRKRTMYKAFDIAMDVMFGVKRPPKPDTWLDEKDKPYEDEEPWCVPR